MNKVVVRSGATAIFLIFKIEQTNFLRAQKNDEISKNS